MQRAFVMLDAISVSVDLPPAEDEVMPGVRWGQVEAFPTPAYWAYQAMARRIEARPIRYRLGQNLREEVGACLLGGHGIPAKIGLLAFEALRARGAFEGELPNADTLFEWLSEPMDVEGRKIKYRFARQKSTYLANALKALESAAIPLSSGRSLRDWLLQLPGIGYKTASWIARNHLDADDVAILDIHILRAGVFAHFLDPELTVERNYLELERQFLTFSKAIGIRPSELDAVIWLDMQASPGSVARALQHLPDGKFKERHAPLGGRSKDRRANANQLLLLA